MAVTADHHRRRATATPNRNATNSEPRGASRAILLKMLNGIPGFRPASIAPLTLLTVPFTSSETSAMLDLGEVYFQSGYDRNDSASLPMDGFAGTAVSEVTAFRDL
jgi:hypothetical protein